MQWLVIILFHAYGSLHAPVIEVVAFLHLHGMFADKNASITAHDSVEICHEGKLQMWPMDCL